MCGNGGWRRYSNLNLQMANPKKARAYATRMPAGSRVERRCESPEIVLARPLHRWYTNRVVVSRRAKIC